jgi:ribosomal protein S18 acetylase RimI-like enzyme
MNTVKIIQKSDLPRLERLWGDIVREEQPEDGEAEGRVIRESRQSLAAFDYLDTDSFWIFTSEAEGRYVGYAAAARIPKADARIGFLYIDELYVLSDYRRQGHATRLLEMAVTHARTLGLGGVRLLVEPESAAARQLYEKLGLVERNLILCER